MSRFNFQVTVHERRGHIFGKDIEGQDAVVREVAEDLAAPGEDFRSGGGLEKLLVAGGLAIGCAKEAMVAEQDAEREMAADEVAKVTFDLMGVDLVDDIADEHDEGPLLAVGVEVQEGVVVARFNQLGEAIEGGVEELIHLLHAAAGWNIGQDAVGESNQTD